MAAQVRRVSIGIGFGLGLLVFLASLTVLASDSTTTSSELGQASATATPFEGASVFNVGDDRSSGLRAVTGNWGTNFEIHSVDYGEILSGGPPRDGIPSIDSPQFVSYEEASEWLADNEPVISLEIAGDARAYPLQVMTWHEIANDTVGGVPVVVTFCPLCNSALVFDRRVGGEVFEFGTSGLLRYSDLVMYDRTSESLWQQFTGEAIVGDLTGMQLVFIPASLVSFADFRETYADGVVLSRDTGFSRQYGRNPYAGYDTVGQNPFLFRGPQDGRLPAMARVVTVSHGDVDKAYAYDTLGDVGVIEDTIGKLEVVVLHAFGTSSALGNPVISDGADVGATGVYESVLDGEKLTLSREGDLFVDAETGSTWNILGAAVDGPMKGKSLTPVVHGDHFWFSWAAFKPDTILFVPDA